MISPRLFPKILTLIGLLFAASPGVAATHHVPGEYPTIQAGLDAAAFGDTVLVAPGTYTDYETRPIGTACAFLVDGVVLRSEQGPAVTTIDMQGQGSGAASVIIGVGLLSGETVVEGFAVAGPPPVLSGSGVTLVEGGRTTIRQCVFADLDSGANAGGVHADHANVEIVHCEFVNCVGSVAGGVWADQEVTVTGSSFRNCGHHAIRLEGEIGGVVETALISDCEFIENWSGRGAGALSIGDCEGGFQITGCHFERNVSTESEGGAMLCGLTFVKAPNTIENCTFVFNRLESGGSGGAVSMFANCTFRGDTFYGNRQLLHLAGGQALTIRDGALCSREQHHRGHFGYGSCEGDVRDDRQYRQQRVLGEVPP
jgi:hypothetical protein